MVIQLIRAANFAAAKHANQRRKDAAATPYINHPIAVASVLTCEIKSPPEELVVVAALLHDTIEDTETSHSEIAAIFGEDVAKLVTEVSDNTSLPREDRKRLQVEHAPFYSHWAKLIKLADKICNMRDVIASPPQNWSLARRQGYFDWAMEVFNSGLAGTHPELEELFLQTHALRPVS